MKHCYRMLMLLVAVGIVLGTVTPLATAEQALTGVTVSPALANIDLQPGQQQQTVNASITNNTASAVTITLSTVDFKSLNDSGGVLFIGSTTYKYGLAKWISLPNGKVSLAPHQTQRLSVTIANRTDLSPGGHYGAIVYKVLPDSHSSAGNNNVNVQQELSTLVFIKKLGGEVYGLRLEHVQLGGSLFHAPESAVLTFRNTGNTQTVPRGLVQVSGPHSPEVSRGLINTDSGLVLPDSTRKFAVPLSGSSHLLWPGRYHVTVHYRYDESGSFATENLGFTYLNLPLLAGSLVGLVVIGLFLRRVVRWRKRRARKTTKTASTL